MLGGPARYWAEYGTHSGVVHMHAGEGDMGDLGRRLVDCFVTAMDDAGLPADAEFRAAMRAYMEWAVAEMAGYPHSKDTVPMNEPMPHWSWHGVVAT